MSGVSYGSKVKLVNKPVWVGAYKEGDTGTVVEYDSHEYKASQGYTLVALDEGDGRVYSIPHGQYEIIEEKEMEAVPDKITLEMTPKIIPEVGDKVKGFKFKDHQCTLGWDLDMESCIGEDGVVGSVDYRDRVFRIDFENDCWWYPISLAHLAYEQTEETKEIDVKTPTTLPDIYGLKIEIGDIRMSRKKLQQQIKELDEKEAALVQQLKEHGFMLVEEKAVEEEDVPQLDMDDPDNWEIDDHLEVVRNEDEHGESELFVGEVVTKVENSSLFEDRITVKRVNGSKQNLKPECFKFHSRPKK